MFLFFFSFIKRDTNIDREVQQQKKAAAAAAAAAKKHSMPTPATFEEKNFLSINKPLAAEQPRLGRKLSMTTKKPLTNLRRKSMIVKKTSAPVTSVTSLEQEIRQLQLRNQFEAGASPLRRLSSPFEAKVVLASSQSGSNKNSIEPINFKSSHGQFLSNFENRLANIGKLDAKKVDASLPPNRSSTPDENQFKSAGSK